MPKSRGDVFVANTSFICYVNGERRRVRKDITRVREGEPMLKGREHLFDSVTDFVHFDVEQATAAPGEKRGRRKPPGDPDHGMERAADNGYPIV